MQRPIEQAKNIIKLINQAIEDIEVLEFSPHGSKYANYVGLFIKTGIDHRYIKDDFLNSARRNDKEREDWDGFCILGLPSGSWREVVTSSWSTTDIITGRPTVRLFFQELKSFGLYRSEIFHLDKLSNQYIRQHAQQKYNLSSDEELDKNSHSYNRKDFIAYLKAWRDIIREESEIKQPKQQPYRQQAIIKCACGRSLSELAQQCFCGRKNKQDPEKQIVKQRIQQYAFATTIGAALAVAVYRAIPFIIG